jgi:membrane complex biogenesis BtpA family protein
MNKFKKMFPKKKKVVIGMVHLAPLLGYIEFPGFKIVRKKFLNDIKALIDGGVDAIMIENNYDIPHYEKAKISTIPQLTTLCIEARKMTKKPLGLCVLWNDYEAAISIAKIAKFDFVRVPVFVDKVKTDYGTYLAKADECIKFRKEINAEEILIFADVQVKHAKHLIKRSLSEAVRDAVKKGADGIIITGKWTGDAPTLNDVKEANKAANKIPIILGSGIVPENVNKYQADAFIIGTYFKKNINRGADYHNIYPWKIGMQKSRIRDFMRSINAA